MRIPTTLSALGLVLLAAVAVHGQAKFDTAARARVIAPLIDEQTIAVTHLDITRVAVEPLLDQIASLRLIAGEQIGVIKPVAALIHQRLIGAGVKEVYAFSTLADGIRRPRLFAAIPLDAASDEKVIREALSMLAVERRGDVLLIAPDKEVLASINAMTPDYRAELGPAVEAAGDTAVQVWLLPPKHYRRVLEEAVGELPKELGGESMKVFTRGVLWVAVGIDLPPHSAVRLTIQSENPQAAEALRANLAQLLNLAGANGGTRKIVPNFDELAALALPRVEGNRLVLTLDENNHGIDRILTALVQPIQSLQRRSAMIQSINNLKQIALAMHNYLDANKHFPLPGSLSPQGKPLLSWRVAVLPYLGEKPLYQQFQLDEPWDSPHNRALIDKMPEVYRRPLSTTQEAGRTNYLLPVGNGAAFSADKPTQIKDITDGTSNTIMVVEADDEHAAIWTKPDDWSFDPKEPAKGLDAGGFYAAFCDGSVRFVPKGTDPKTLKALFTRAGGEVIGDF